MKKGRIEKQDDTDDLGVTGITELVEANPGPGIDRLSFYGDF